jgi:hypothetical protein
MIVYLAIGINTKQNPDKLQSIFLALLFVLTAGISEEQVPFGQAHIGIVRHDEKLTWLYSLKATSVHCQIFFCDDCHKVSFMLIETSI